MTADPGRRGVVVFLAFAVLPCSLCVRGRTLIRFWFCATAHNSAGSGRSLVNSKTRPATATAGAGRKCDSGKNSRQLQEDKTKMPGIAVWGLGSTGPGGLLFARWARHGPKRLCLWPQSRRTAHRRLVSFLSTETGATEAKRLIQSSWPRFNTITSVVRALYFFVFKHGPTAIFLCHASRVTFFFAQLVSASFFLFFSFNREERGEKRG